MAAYGDLIRSEPGAARLDALLAITDRDERIVEAGEIAQALIDAGFDERLPLALCLAAARAEDLEPIVRELPRPERIESKTPEGFAFYAVYPELYARAAKQVPRDGKRTVVVGIRTIGTSLGAVVAAAVDADEFFTVRPTGHPFDRQVDDPRLHDPDARYLVVDEGPGLSGSSFASVAIAAAGEVIFFPSHPNPPGTFASDRVREIWARTPKLYVDLDVREFFGANVVDIGAGQWRERVGGARDVPVWASHERRKYIVDGKYLLKFAGVGRYGGEKFARIRGTSPGGLALEHGFIRYEWIEGARIAAKNGALLDAVRRHLESSDTDGRMHPWEWIADRTGRVYKTDAVDHAFGHDALGPQPKDWDIAGAAIELGFRDDELPPYDHAFLARYTEHQREIYEQAAREARDPVEKARLETRAAFYSQCALNDSISRSV